MIKLEVKPAQLLFGLQQVVSSIVYDWFYPLTRADSSNHPTMLKVLRLHESGGKSESTLNFSNHVGYRSQPQTMPSDDAGLGRRSDQLMSSDNHRWTLIGAGICHLGYRHHVVLHDMQALATCS